MRLHCMTVVAVCVLATAPAFCADYPEHPLRLVVPFTPAGATDVLARLTGDDSRKVHLSLPCSLVVRSPST